MGILYSHIVFQPPDPPTYDNNGLLIVSNKTDRDSFESSIASDEQLELPVVYIKTEKGNTIIGAFFHRREAHFTILFSHGNGEDIGCVANYALHLSETLNCNVLVYDYSGYGHSEVTEKRIQPGRIILFGRSLGSGPTVELASKLGKSCGGVVLISGIASCLRVALGSTPRVFRFDMFQNVEKIHRILVPVFCVHGMLDNVVPFDHGLELCRKSKYPLKPLWVRDAGHNNLEGPRFQKKVFSRYIDVIHEFYRWNHA